MQSSSSSVDFCTINVLNMSAWPENNMLLTHWTTAVSNFFEIMFNSDLAGVNCTEGKPLVPTQNWLVPTAAHSPAFSKEEIAQWKNIWITVEICSNDIQLMPRTGIKPLEASSACHLPPWSNILSFKNAQRLIFWKLLCSSHFDGTHVLLMHRTFLLFPFPSWNVLSYSISPISILPWSL